MDIKLYSFGEALEKLKKKEINLLVRAKHMDADFINKCILLHNTSRYISLGKSMVSGSQQCLWQTVKKENGERVASYAKVDSDDILAEDYIDTNQWTLCYYKEEYDKFIQNLLKNGVENNV